MIESTVEKYIASILSVPAKVSNDECLDRGANKDLNAGVDSDVQRMDRWTSESAMNERLMIQRKMSQTHHNQRKADQLPIAVIGHPDDMVKDYDGQTIKYQIDIVTRTEDEIKEYVKRINYILSKVLELKHEDNKYIGVSEITSKKIDFIAKENVWKASVVLVVSISYAGKMLIQ